MLQLIFIKPSDRISPESLDVTNKHNVSCTRREGGGENFHMKGAGLLVVSLRGLNFGFWSPFNGCSEQNVIILGLHAKIYI